MNYKIINKNNKFLVTKGMNSISFDNEEDANRFIKVSEYLIDNPEINESKYDYIKTVKDYAANQLADFFRIDVKLLNNFKFDGTDNITKLTNVLNSTSEKGTEMYYKAAIKSAKKSLNISESINEEDLEESDDELNNIPDYIKSLMNLGTFKF